MENINNEKDRSLTEKKLLKALEDIIIEDGFEKIGVNSISSRAGVSKILIYRYFGSLNDMVIEYLSQNDFWINFSIGIPNHENLREFIKEMFRKQIIQLRENCVMKMLYRWELSQNNTIIEKLRLKREAQGITLVTIISQLSQTSQEEVASLATLLNAAISYLVLLSDNCPVYNGIDIQDDKGWKQLNKGINLIVDIWCDKNNIN